MAPHCDAVSYALIVGLIRHRSYHHHDWLMPGCITAGASKGSIEFDGHKPSQAFLRRYVGVYRGCCPVMQPCVAMQPPCRHGFKRGSLLLLTAEHHRLASARLNTGQHPLLSVADDPLALLRDPQVRSAA